jgi:hypothetical protein
MDIWHGYEIDVGSRALLWPTLLGIFSVVTNMLEKVDEKV